jgi:hypothetical protein
MVQGGPTRPVSSSRGLRRSAPRVCDWTLVWPDQHVQSVHLGAEKGMQPMRLVPHGTSASGWEPRGAERGEELIERVARPVMCDRTRPITRGAL